MSRVRVRAVVSPPLRPTVGAREDGFALVEVLVAALVLFIGIFAMAQFISSASFRVRDSEDRLVLQQTANREIEKIRALPYDQVGTVGGNPAGGLLDDTTTAVEGVSVRVQTEVMYIEDPAYAAQPANQRPFPANYRRATVIVTAVGNNRIDPVQVSTNVAGGAQGGTLDITATDVAGNPVEDVLLVITNTHLSPNVNIDSDAIRTDYLGKMLVPGLTPDNTANYSVRGNKTGCNSYQINPMVLVNEGIPYTQVSVIVDLLDTINIHLVNDATPAVPLSGVQLRVTGPLWIPPWTQTLTVTTDANGNVTMPNMVFSTSKKPYIIQLVSPGSRPPLTRVFGSGETPPTIDPSVVLTSGQVAVIAGGGGDTEQVNLVWPR